MECLIPLSGGQGVFGYDSYLHIPRAGGMIVRGVKISLAQNVWKSFGLDEPKFCTMFNSPFRGSGGFMHDNSVQRSDVGEHPPHGRLICL